MNKKNNLIFIVIFLLLEVVAYINSYVVDLKAASVDSGRFQDLAVIWARNGSIEFVTDAEFFIQFLGIIFRFFGASEFLATQFGLIALMYALVYVRKTMLILGIGYINLVLIAIALWPSSITRVTTTMREPYLIMVLVCICYQLVLYSKSGEIKRCLYALIWALVGALFHKAYAVLLIGIGLYVFLVAKSSSGGRESSAKKLIKLLVVFGLIFSFFAFEDTISNVRGLKPMYSVLSQDTDYMSRVVEYKANREFRTTYDVKIDFDSPATILTSAPITFAYYMFAPFPWMISTPVDLYAFFEAMVRLWGCYILYILARRSKLGSLKSSTFVVLMLSFVWAAGTANYGTASRHHITTNWFFFLMYAYYFSLGSYKKSRRMKTTNLKHRTIND